MASVPEDLTDVKIKEEVEQVEEEEKSFEELGLDPRLVRALTKKGVDKPTPIQLSAIPLILEGKDVVARAKTGSGKTYAYLLPMLQNLFSDSGLSNKTAPRAFVLVPTRELCQQVYSDILYLIESCRVQLKVVQVTSSMSITDLSAALAGPPDILVSTPACISTCMSSDVIHPKSIQDSLSILVLDEADLLLSYGYEDDLKALTPHVPRRCQCLLMSATSSADVEKLKKLVLHNPVILTLSEVGDIKDEVIPKNVQQFWRSCNSRDKLLNILALLKFELVQKKVLIFVNTIDMGYRLKLYLEQFGIRSAVLNAELPQNSRLHILEEFNAGLFDYLIATDDSQIKEKEQIKEENHVASKKSRKKQKLDSEFGVVRGIDFKNVYTVINFEMPLTAEGYVHRIGRTGRAYNTGASVSLVSPDEMEVFEEIKSTFSDDDNKDNSNFIAPFPLLTENAVESLRYRAEEFNAGLFDYLIATDDSQIKEKEQIKEENHVASKKSRKKQKLDSEFGVVRGIDFKNVYTVINFEMPLTAEGYVHRIGRTGRAYNTGASVSLVSPDEMEVFEEIKSTFSDDDNKDNSNFIAPFPLLTENAVESLRYRAEDVSKSVTKVAIREARAQDLRNEILNSEKLKAHFQDNPKDLEMLKHDKQLSKKAPPTHLRAVPEYLLDPTTEEASKIVKLARAAMGSTDSKNRRRPMSKGKSRRSRDPLKTFSAGGSKKFNKDGNKRKVKDKGSKKRKAND